MKGNKEKSARGGARAGAGRPRGDGRLFTFRASGELAELLESQADRTAFIRRSLQDAVRDNRKEAAVRADGDDIRTADGAAGGHASGKAPLNATRASDAAPLHLPFFDQRVVAGFPVPLDNDERSQDINILAMLCPHPESCYLIRIKGDSMIDAGIMDGDIVIVDKSRRDPAPKEIAVCELNGEYTLKHFIEEDGQGWLVPANPDYPRFRVTVDDEFSIWGTVTYIIHKARD